MKKTLLFLISFSVIFLSSVYLFKPSPELAPSDSQHLCNTYTDLVEYCIGEKYCKRIIPPTEDVDNINQFIFPDSEGNCPIGWESAVSYSGTMCGTAVELALTTLPPILRTSCPNDCMGSLKFVERKNSAKDCCFGGRELVCTPKNSDFLLNN